VPLCGVGDRAEDGYLAGSPRDGDYACHDRANRGRLEAGAIVNYTRMLNPWNAKQIGEHFSCFAVGWNRVDLDYLANADSFGMQARVVAEELNPAPIGFRERTSTPDHEEDVPSETLDVVFVKLDGLEGWCHNSSSIERPAFSTQPLSEWREVRLEDCVRITSPYSSLYSLEVVAEVLTPLRWRPVGHPS
jgi:hypothetical protein